MIKIKNQIKYLGLYIYQHLNWGPQIKHINNKLAKNIGIITKLRYYVNLHTIKQLYYSFIYPYLTYAITSWGSACRIRTKQNKCIRSIFFAHSRENATSYYNLFLFCSLFLFIFCLIHVIIVTLAPFLSLYDYFSLRLMSMPACLTRQ